MAFRLETWRFAEDFDRPDCQAEIKLLTAILERAIMDIADGMDKKGTEYTVRARSALNWIYSNRREFCCDYLKTILRFQISAEGETGYNQFPLDDSIWFSRCML